MLAPCKIPSIAVIVIMITNMVIYHNAYGNDIPCIGKLVLWVKPKFGPEPKVNKAQVSGAKHFRSQTFRSQTSTDGFRSQSRGHYAFLVL